MEAVVVVDAIVSTGWARNPTPYYMRAILRRYLRERILTADDLRGDKADRCYERGDARERRENSWFY